MNCLKCGYPLWFDFETDQSHCSLCAGLTQPKKIVFRLLPEWDFMSDDQLVATYLLAVRLGVWICVDDCFQQFQRRPDLPFAPLSPPPP